MQDTGWFFDTELLVLAQRAGLRIHEVPVDWVDDPDSRVDIVATADLADLRGIARLGRALADRGAAARPTCGAQLGRAPLAAGVPGLPASWSGSRAIGVAEHAGVPAALRAAAGPASGRRPPTCWRCCVTAVANTAANRRLTFGVTGRRHPGRHQAQGCWSSGSAGR